MTSGALSTGTPSRGRGIGKPIKSGGAALHPNVPRHIGGTGSYFAGIKSMIDRAARNQLISAIEDYAEGRVASHAFEDRLDEIPGDDQTVCTAIDWLWFYYDDVQNTKASFDKSAWDFVQRIILLLQSDAEISVETIGSRHWSWTNGVALVGFLMFLASAITTGWTQQLLAPWLGAAVISAIIWRYSKSSEDDSTQSFTPAQAALFPFESFGQLRRIKEQASSFTRKKFPGYEKSSTFRDRIMSVYSATCLIPLWTGFAPLILFFQGLPSYRGPNIWSIDTSA